MEVRVNSLKILNDVLNREKEIESLVINIKGVLDCKVKSQNNCYRLDYVLDNWASEYDVMVSIMELLQSEFLLDSEPYFEDEEGYSDTEFDYQNLENLNGDTKSEHEGYNCNHEHDSEHHHDEHDDCEHEGCGHLNEHRGFSCSCNHDDKEVKSSSKGKIIELGVSFVFFILGIILSNIENLKQVAPYMFVIGYSVAGYEVIFEGVIGIFKKKFFSENLLMTIASISAIILGETAEAYGIMLLFSIGELFEHTAIDNSNKVIESLKNMCPKTVNVLKDGKEVKTPVKSIKVGDIIVLKAGEIVAIDSKIIKGSASFDSKTVTGESKYKDLEAGDLIFGGFKNIDGYVEVEALKDYNNSTLSKIMEIVSDSSSKKSKKESFMEKFSKWYTPTILILAVLLTFIPPIFAENYASGLKVWAIRGIMLLCISCPCALVISVPLTYFCGVGAAAKNGVLIKSTNTLEKLSSCDTVVFDKTGTLTKGELKVSKVIATKNYKGQVLNLASILEQNSLHPIGVAIKKNAGDIKGELTSFKEIAGKGIIADYNGKTHVLGNYKFILENGVNAKEIEEIGTKLYLAVDGEFAGAIILNDEIRDEAYGAILELKHYGVYKSVMLTGDSREYAKAIRKELKMTTSVSELLPEDKVKELEKIIDENGKKSVAFVGDGINDTGAIIRADVGFAMGALGSDSAIESADIVLTQDDLSKVPYTVKLAKRTNIIAKQNIIGSLAVKGIIMLISVLGISSSLWLAISADVGVMILAVLNAIRNRME